jgi:small-conductance mechanosensitive channel
MLEQFQSFITPILELVGESTILQALIVVVASFAIASIFKYIMILGFKKLIDSTQIELESGFLDLLRAPIYYSVLLIGLSIALSIINPEATYFFVVSSILKSTAMLIWTIFLLKANNRVLKGLAQHPTRFNSLNPKTLPLFENILYIIIIVLAVYLVFSIWNVDMTAWLASAGIVGIAVGFAAKDTLANLFSGVFIMADAPYKVGDFVVLDSGERGEITHIGIRSTRMFTRDHIEITIPNSVMGNSKIVNESGGPHQRSRCRIAVGVSYDSDIELVRSVLLAIASKEELVCVEPEAKVRFLRFSGSALDFELHVWIEQPELKGSLIDSINSEIYTKFKENNIEIPYSKQDLYIKEMPSRG